MVGNISLVLQLVCGMAVCNIFPIQILYSPTLVCWRQKADYGIDNDITLHSGHVTVLVV